MLIIYDKIKRNQQSSRKGKGEGSVGGDKVQSMPKKV